MELSFNGDNVFVGRFLSKQTRLYDVKPVNNQDKQFTFFCLH